MKRTRFAKRGLQNDRPHQHLLLQGVLREVPHRPQPHGRGVAQSDVFLLELQVKSTTPERLAVCWRITEALPVEVRAVVATIERVTDMRIRLMQCLVLRKRWCPETASTFVQKNGSVWR